jgi:Ricin-type beta-trefoil lectin domain-like/Cellulase (glycosyl hydrolase family 5)
MHFTSHSTKAANMSRLGARLWHIAIALTIGICFSTASASAQLLANGTYTITSKLSGQVVDVTGASTTEGTDIDQWASSGTANQKWNLTNLGSNYVSLINVNSGMALDVYGASTTAGGAIDQWPYSSGKNQIWRVVSEGGGYYELINENSGQALDVTGDSTVEGTKLDQYTISGNANQLWSFAPVSGGTGGGNLIANGTYLIKSDLSGLVVDVTGASTAEGTDIEQWTDNNTANQQWNLTNLGSNYVSLVNVNSGLAMEVYSASTTSGAAIDQWPYSSGKNQIWQVVSKGGGYYELLNENSGEALDVTGASSATGVKLDQYTVSGNSNQLWSFIATTPATGGGSGNTCSGGRFLPVMGSCGYIKGANLAWLDGHYSYYLGVDPHNPSYGVDYSSTDMNAALANMHSMGIIVVRLWLFQDDQGCNLDGNGNVTSVTQTFWTNLDNTVQLAANNHIALYMTLNNGRADFQENSTLLNDFINNALIPLINRYKGNSAVFAIDAMNEIDGTVAGSSGNYTTTGSTWAQAQQYMKTVAAAIHGADPNRLVTTSTGWHTWTNIQMFKGLGLDFYDFHVYADDGYVPTVASLDVDKPIYMGESGQSTDEFNDALQNTAETNFLSNTDTGGYAGLGIWDYDWAGADDIYQMLESNGAWRPVDYTILDFKP